MIHLGDEKKKKKKKAKHKEISKYSMHSISKAHNVLHLTTSVTNNLTNNLDNLQFFFRERVVVPKSVFEKFRLVKW